MMKQRLHEWGKRGLPRILKGREKVTFRCVNCEYAGNSFGAEVVEISRGVFHYRAKCPACGDWKINVIGSVKEEDLRISFVGGK